MYVKFLLLAFVSATLAVEDPAWTEYKEEFGKVYSAGEDEAHYDTWLNNVMHIELHNAQYDKTFTQGVNKYTDLTDEEFQVEMGGPCSLEVPNVPSGQQFVPSNVAVADEVDWRDHGYVTPVKNQASCGSCYSFSATGALEGAWYKKTGNLISLSESQIVDCSGRYGNHGCHGGWYHYAWNYHQAVGGAQTEQSYPYRAHQYQCRFDASHIAAKVTGHTTIGYGDESGLKTAVGTVGPVAVAIDASPSSFRNYKHGVHYAPRCSPQRLTHAVLAVGYGSEGGQDYWLVKNSWGTWFGLSGYIKMARNRNNNCGIASRAAYPNV